MTGIEDTAGHEPSPSLKGEQPDFVVGGQDRTLSPEEQLEQLRWYLNEHHPAPDFRAPWVVEQEEGHAESTERIATRRAEGDNWAARLPDRLTHSAMIMLGAAVDHTMPGTAYAQGVSAKEVALPSAQDAGENGDQDTYQGTLLVPSGGCSEGTWVISLHGGGFWRGAGAHREFSWLPEMAAIAELSACPVLDVNYPLYPRPLREAVSAAKAAIGYARAQGAHRVVLLAASAGAFIAQALAGEADAPVDALVLQRPSQNIERLPEDFRAGVHPARPATWPPTLIQEGTMDTRVPPTPQEVEELEQVQVRRYVADHQIIVPKVARERVRDAAGFIAQLCA